MSEPIRILQVFAQMNKGGAETMIMNLYRNIDRNKVQFDFIVHTNKTCEYDDEIKLLGGKIYRIPRFTVKNIFFYYKSWNEFFKKHSEYKIIHGHVRSTAAIYLKIAKKYCLTTIAHSHSTSSGTGFIAVIKNILQYPIRYTADYLFSCSNPAGKWLFGEKACKGNNYFIINNAIDAKKFIFNNDIRIEKRKELNIENKFVIGHVGRFQLPKNHEFLIDIFKVIHDKNNNAILLLVGDGELRHIIEKKVKKLNLSDNVILIGIRNDIPELLQAMDVFVLPSLYEGLGIVAIEAQASGMPCIVADTIPKEVYITNSIKVESLKSSTEKWANNILKYAYGYKRSSTYEEIKSKGYDIAEATKWMENFYIKICHIN